MSQLAIGSIASLVLSGQTTVDGDLGLTGAGQVEVDATVQVEAGLVGALGVSDSEVTACVDREVVVGLVDTAVNSEGLARGNSQIALNSAVRGNYIIGAADRAQGYGVIQ